MTEQNLNRLAKASSPYLLQHAHNPVDWYEWGEEALQKARDENKPLIISIGYSACHWCHVMEAESFMDQEVADFMNQHFVCIKVDREERPDIDQIYIEAAQLLNGNAGWPLNAFALPDGRPFWVGVYFPKKNWINVLEQLHKIFTEEPEKIKEQAEALTDGIRNEPLFQVKIQGENSFELQEYESLYPSLKSKIDLDRGGFKSPQKFPMTSGWEFLLQYAALTKDEDCLSAVNITLKAMAFGGIYDHLGGGFSRYAVDEDWFAPHFEKMLYDNAQLISLYSQAYRFTKNELYEKVVKESLAFVQRELKSDEGAFYSALNADSEGEEGKFYVWKATEIDELLEPEQAELFKAYYNVIPVGNWENGQNILFRSRSDEEFAELIGMRLNMIDFKIHSAKNLLMEARSKRIRPTTDDKVLTSWNALMIKAYVDAYRSFHIDSYLENALTAANFITSNTWKDDGGLFRNYKDGKATIHGFLDDYAFLADAFINLYEVTFEIGWLKKARRLIDFTLEHFSGENGLCYYTSDQSEQLIARKIHYTDSEIPSANAVVADVLLKLGRYYDQPEYLNRSHEMLKNLKPLLKEGSPYFGRWAQVLGNITNPAKEVAITGTDAVQKALKLQEYYLPNTIVLGGTKVDLPLLQDKIVKGENLIYICENKTCQKPVNTIEEALKQLGI